MCAGNASSKLAEGFISDTYEGPIGEKNGFDSHSGDYIQPLPTNRGISLREVEAIKRQADFVTV